MHAATHEIVGREPELETLAGFVDSLSAGPVLGLIEGAAGIGKTTLWSETVARAERGGHHVLVSRPLEAEADLSFTGLGDLLDDVLDLAVPHLPSPQRSALEVALLRSERTEAHPEPRAVGLALLGVLRTLAASSPVLLAIDDLHWLDLPSARAVQFAVHRLKGEPVGILLSRRSGEREPFELERLVPAERVILVGVEPLSRGAVARLIRARVSAPFTRATLLRLHTASGGNPFYALEIARALERHGLEPGRDEPLAVPETLTGLLRGRLATVPARTRRALLAAAAAASPTVALVAAVLRTKGADSALAPAIEGGIITLDGGRVRFAHPLLASVLYADASDDERRRVHAALADAVVDVEERAAHLARAAHGPDVAVAATLEEAAGAARARGAPETAAELAEQASRLTPADRAEDAARRRVDAAEHHVQAGDQARARVLLERAVATLEPGRVRARGLLALSLVQRQEASLREESYATAEQALREVGDDDRLRADIERQLSYLYEAAGQPLKAEPHARAALELAERLGDRVLLAESLAEYASVEFFRGRGFRRDLLERALALGTLYEHRRLLLHPSYDLALMLLRTGEYADARSSLKTLLRVAHERGDENAPPWLLWISSEVELGAGNWDAAQYLAEEAHALAVDTGQDSARRTALCSRADICACQGEIETARTLAEEQLATGTEVGEVRARRTLGFIELSIGNSAAAVGYLTPLLRDTRPGGIADPSVDPFEPDLIEALVACGEFEHAEPVLEWLEERGRTLDRASALATAARCRALLWAARGQLGDALDVTDDALGYHGRMEQPFELGRTLLVKGQDRPAREKEADRAGGARGRSRDLRPPRRSTVVEAGQGRARTHRGACSGP
jgi:tetratricopeptide (TPR) repeat protein